MSFSQKFHENDIMFNNVDIIFRKSFEVNIIGMNLTDNFLNANLDILALNQLNNTLFQIIQAYIKLSKDQFARKRIYNGCSV